MFLKKRFPEGFRPVYGLRVPHYGLLSTVVRAIYDGLTVRRGWHSWMRRSSLPRSTYVYEGDICMLYAVGLSALCLVTMVMEHDKGQALNTM